MPTRLVLVDDHDGFRALVAQLLGERFEIVGEAGTARDALAVARRVRPEAVLLDVQLPDALGFDVIEELSQGGARVVLTSTRSADEYGDRIANSRSVGFIAKHELSDARLAGLLDAQVDG